MKKTSFVPKKDQVDFTHARFAPVVNCVLFCEEEMLLVKRSDTLNFYPRYYNGISGFLDDTKSLEEKVLEELHEELGIQEGVQKITLCGIFHQEEKTYKKTWIVHAVRVEVSSKKVLLDWEASEYVWISPEKAHTYNLLPGFERVLALVSPTQKNISLPEKGLYYHYKRTADAGVAEYAYELLGVGKHTETDELEVVYRPLYVSEHLPKGVPFFIRPLAMWEEQVLQDGVLCARFQKITGPEIIPQIVKTRTE